MTNKLVKGKNRKWLGVCSGIAEYVGIDVTVIRLITVLLTVFGGFIVGLVLYWIASMVIPNE
jgi:phage shock protein C